MFILIIVLVIVIISIVWAVISLRKEMQKHDVEDVKQDISRGRVIYHSSDVESK